MSCYWEWGICVLSLFLWWWRYGWNFQDTKRSLRYVYKRFEIILTAHAWDSSTHPIETSGRRRRRHPNFLSIPVTRTQFMKRSYEIPEDFSAKLNGGDTEVSFYKTVPLLRVGRQDGYRSPSSTCSSSAGCCSVCDHRTQHEKLELDPHDLKNCLEFDTEGPENPWYVRKFSSIVFFWRKWFLQTDYHMVPFKDTMDDERVNNAILEAAKHELRENPKSATLDILVEKNRIRAEKLIINMRAKQAKPAIFCLYARFASWIIGMTLKRIYPSIYVRNSQLEVLRQARKSGHPILYLPIHRSHVDYVLVSWVLVASNIRSPVVAAGDNLNIPVFHMMMRSVGGFFIKRRLQAGGSRDMLYQAILHSYMERSVLDDNDLEFFIEGGRTRTGKPCTPKGGLLSIAMDTVLSGKVEDMLVVPVNFSYDKLLEGNYIREQLGKAKTKESFLSAAFGLWNSIQTKFGNARIDFGHPFSAREFIRMYKSWKAPSYFQQYSCESCISDSDHNNNEEYERDSDLTINDKKDFIRNLAQHVIYDGVKNLSVMSTNVVAFLLLNKFRDGITMDILLKELELLKLDLKRRHHDLSADNDMRQALQHALTILGPNLVRRELIRSESTRQAQMFLKPVTVLPNVLELAYYSTCLNPIYALESVIATSILVLKGRTLGDAMEADYHMTDVELISTSMELCGILQNEFTFHPPCQTLETAIRKSLDDLKTQGLLVFERPGKFYETYDGLLSFQSVDLIYVSRDDDSVRKLEFLHGLIAPLLDTYAVSSIVLSRLVGCEAPEKHLQMDMLAEVKCHLQQHLIKYGESLALDPIRNFIRLLVEWQVLETSTQNYVTTYVLSECFDIEDSVDSVMHRIKRFQI